MTKLSKITTTESGPIETYQSRVTEFLLSNKMVNRMALRLAVAGVEHVQQYGDWTSVALLIQGTDEKMSKSIKAVFVKSFVGATCHVSRKPENLGQVSFTFPKGKDKELTHLFVKAREFSLTNTSIFSASIAELFLAVLPRDQKSQDLKAVFQHCAEYCEKYGYTMNDMLLMGFGSPVTAPQLPLGTVTDALNTASVPTPPQADKILAEAA